MTEEQITRLETYIESPLYSVFWDMGLRQQEIIKIDERGSLKLGLMGRVHNCEFPYDGECIELWNTSVEDILVFKKVDWRKGL